MSALTATYDFEVTDEEKNTYRATLKQARNLSDEHLACRAGNHAWSPQTAERVRGGYIRTERCRNDCGCTRYQELNRWGLVLKSKITYPKGYLLKGIGRLTGAAKGAVRIESVERQIRGG